MPTQCLNSGGDSVACSTMSDFIFQSAWVLALLLLALPLWWLLAYARTRRAELIDAMGGGMSNHRVLRDHLRVVAFILLVLALARPGYAPEKLSISRTGRDVVFALDVSQSMLAEDTSPSRLEVCKQAVRDTLKTFSNERVGLVVYAGSATILCPLTYDYDFVRYMLEQAHTRTVDFGGTTLQSAVEKVVDQVFMADRFGMQDLVVLTDGGDRGSQIPAMVELLNDSGVGLLLVGVGNSKEGVPIPIVDEEGVRSLLRSEEGIIYTKLVDATLREFARLSSDAEYVPVGTQVFDLGQIYAGYVIERDVSSPVEGEGILIYQQAAVFLVIPALLLLLLSECWGAHGLRFGHSLVTIALFGMSLPESRAAAASDAQFTEASKLYIDGAYAGALELFNEVANKADILSLAAVDLAAIEFNRGLCFLALSKAESEGSPQLGLSHAQQAQLAFLAAKRYAPDLVRSGIRLESTAEWVNQLQLRIAAEDEAQEELQLLLKQLVERLQALLAEQQDLRQTVVDDDMNHRHSENKQDLPRVTQTENNNVAGSSRLVYQELQLELNSEAKRILVRMKILNTKMMPATKEGMPKMKGLLTEPLKLMEKVPAVMQQASGLLANRTSWAAADAEQRIAEYLIEEILSLLNKSSSEESDEDQMDEWDEDGEYDYSDAMDESIMSSMPIEGDLAAGGEMQALPVPNYSAEEILMQEQGSLQFRQQQRAKANAGKVKEDY